MNRKDRDDELERELRAHLEMEADELRDQGLAPLVTRLGRRGRMALASSCSRRQDSARQTSVFCEGTP